MDLSKIVAPEGEKTVLMVGENHDHMSTGSGLTLCKAFQPDVVVIEYDIDRIIRSGLDYLLHELRENPEQHCHYRVLLQDYSYKSAAIVAAMYAAQHEIPLYLADWHPTHPDNIGDFFSGESPSFVYYYAGPDDDPGWAGLGRSFESTIETLLGFDEKMEALNMQAKTYKVRARGKKEEMKRFLWYNVLCETPQAMLIRNEYTAMVLNSIDAERILYIGGAGHFRPVSCFIEDWHQKFDFITPLQDLVVADNKYYIDLPAFISSSQRQYLKEELGTDELPIKVTETKTITLPWETLEYMQKGGSL